MYFNTCSKCGSEFETKNPKRVVCPACLYPDRMASPGPQQQQRPQGQGGYGPPRQGQGGYGPPRQGGYGPPRQGGYGPPRQGGGRPGGFGGGRPMGGRGGPPRRGGPGGRPGGGGRPKKLLITKEQLIEIEKLYKAALPLPNPDIHEEIGTKLDIQPSKVFFGMNLVRAKMKLPKLEYPKRKLALTPEQLMAIEALYEGYLPVPPIGIHKIIAKQLKIEEWRVHVGIGLIRKGKGMDRWNEAREDLPPQMKEAIEAGKAEKPEKTSDSGKTADEAPEEKPAKAAKTTKAKKAPVVNADDAPEAAVQEETDDVEEVVAEEKKSKKA
ncbi:MAG: hypothetical protein KTR14_03300 [Vampirovibrio sp.]|nr:hypothetical protein [Vampirovibrio sp.]